MMARDDAADALYQAGIVTGLLRLTAKANMAGGVEVCGAILDWLAQQLEAQHARIEAAAAAQP